MVPKASPPATPHPGTPAFLARVMALPALNQAIHTVYDTSKNNVVVSAALRAAERSVQVAATNALPLANPLVERVGGWAAVDEWACRGLDRVEKAAPIINLPAGEIVQRTRQTVLQTLAGDKVIVPPTLLEAVRTRANRVVDQFVETPVMKQVTGLVESSLDTAEGYLDTVLPRGKGDRRQSFVPGEGVVTRTIQLGQRASHRLYRVAVRRMRPDLTYDPRATISIDMVVNYTRTTLLDQLSELARQPEPGESFGLVMSVVRWPIRTTSNAATSLAITYDTLSARGFQLADKYLPRLTVSVSRARASATEAAQMFTVFLQQPQITSRQAVARVAPLLQQSVDLARERLVTLMPLLQQSVDLARERLVTVTPLLQGRIQGVREQTTQLIILLQKTLTDSAVPSVQARAELLRQRIAELAPAVQATLKSLREAAQDLPDSLRESVAVMLPLLQKRMEALIDSLPLEAKTQAELKEMMVRAAEEVRMWSSAGIVAIRMTPGIALYGSQLTRRMVTQILMDILYPGPSATTTATTTSPRSPTSPRPALVPVKVTMMVPRKDKKKSQEAVKGGSAEHDHKTK